MHEIVQGNHYMYRSNNIIYYLKLFKREKKKCVPHPSRPLIINKRISKEN